MPRFELLVKILLLGPAYEVRPPGHHRDGLGGFVHAGKLALGGLEFEFPVHEGWDGQDSLAEPELEPEEVGEVTASLVVDPCFHFRLSFVSPSKNHANRVLVGRSRVSVDVLQVEESFIVPGQFTTPRSQTGWVQRELPQGCVQERLMRLSGQTFRAWSRGRLLLRSVA